MATLALMTNTIVMRNKHDCAINQVLLQAEPLVICADVFVHPSRQSHTVPAWMDALCRTEPFVNACLHT